jgi:hypothetical protein
MRSKFDEPFELDRSGSIEVCGPLKDDPPDVLWEEGEDEVSVYVCVVQGPAVGVATSPPGFGRDEDEWMFHISAHGGRDFEPGRALAMAVAVGNGSAGPFAWARFVDIA